MSVIIKINKIFSDIVKHLSGNPLPENLLWQYQNHTRYHQNHGGYKHNFTWYRCNLAISKQNIISNNQNVTHTTELEYNDIKIVLSINET